MKTSYSLLLLFLGIILLTIGCSKEEGYLISDERIEIRKDKGGDIPAGCDNCRVFLSVDKGCNMKVVLTEGCIGNVTYQWTTPSGNSSIPNPDASVNGNYCVNIFTDQGCYASACTNVLNCQDACDNDCVEVTLNSQDCKLVVNLNDCDSQPKNIIWSTPMNFIPVGTTVTPQMNGVYCAHVSFADGCQYTDCFSYRNCEEFCEDDCIIEFEVNNTATNCYMTVNTIDCSGPFEIEWTDPNGLNTSNSFISIQEDGLYCVQVTQSNGCDISACTEIINCIAVADCINVDLTWVDFSDGQYMVSDIDELSHFNGAKEYEQVQPNNIITKPVAYFAGLGFYIQALFKADCSHLGTIFVRGKHQRSDGTFIDFPAQEIQVNMNGEIHYNWEPAMMNGNEFIFPERVEFHDPFEIEWEFSFDQINWSYIHTSENPLYVTRDYWQTGNSDPVPPLHTYFRIGCELANNLVEEDEIIAAIWEVFKQKEFVRADNSKLAYYGDWNTTNVYAEQLIAEKNGQCSAHSMAFLNCLKAQGINYEEDYLVVTASQDGKELGFLVENFSGKISPPGTSWAVDSWAIGGEPIGLPDGFDIEYVVIPKQGFEAVANNFQDNMIYSEINDESGLAGQNEPNPKAYFLNHQFVYINSKFYDVPYGGQYEFLNDIKGNLFGYIYVTEATISEETLGFDLIDPLTTSDVTMEVWLIDRDLDNQVSIHGESTSQY